MEPQPLAKHVDSTSKIRFFPGSTSLQEPEVINDGPRDADEPSHRKNQVVPHDVIEIDEDGDPFGEESMGTKHKEKLGYDKNWPIQIKDELTEDHTDLGPATSSPINPPETFTLDKYNSDSMDVDDGDVDYDYNEDDDIDDDDYYEDEDDDGYALSLDAQFDAKDLPPGVEATVPWLQMPANPMLGASSTTFPGQPCSRKQFEEKDDEILKKFSDFKHFDTVNDYSDHYFIEPNKSSKSSHSFGPIISRKDSSQGGSLTKKTQKDWSKKIQEEWKILENNLPDSIFVRAYEERMDLMRAVIIGSAGTPYHDGLFFFDILFPSDYPAHPPRVYYHSGGLRLNPNLYACGRVCLSLLNTWTGSKNEQWTPGKSTMLQVLVSIQGLVLNSKPYFNEPGYEKSAGKPEGERKSLAYNEETFLLSCKTMLYTLRRPPKHFEDFIVGHYRQRAHAILEACKGYMDGSQVGFPVGVRLQDGSQVGSPVGVLVQDGSQVGSPVGVKVQDANKGHKSCFSTFKAQLGQMFPALLVAFTDNGADCRLFLPEKADTTLKL